MAKHTATVTVNAPLDQAYKFWSHFNDYPKFMSFVKEVTYIDDQRSHWVVDVVGRHEWDAVNEGWRPNETIGWRSTAGAETAGKVTFRDVGGATEVTVLLDYDPPAGLLGDLGEAMGGGARVQKSLEDDLENFARMVEDAGPGALDPASSAYLFHPNSAAGKGETTEAQDESMGSTSFDSQSGFQTTLAGADPSARYGAGRADASAPAGHGGAEELDDEFDETRQTSSSGR
ncbi:MAG TPA: SRPBCC family protein [Armatimonadota bacterium]|jgi:hypothetical protein